MFLFIIQRQNLNFEPRLKFETRLKYGWFHLNLYSVFQDLRRRSIETGFGGFETRLKFNKFGLRTPLIEEVLRRTKMF